MPNPSENIPKKQIKIAFCLFKYFPHGGLQKDFWRIVNLLSEKYSIEIFTTEWQSDLPKNAVLNIIPVTQLSNHQRMQQFGEQAIKEAKQKQCKKIISFNKIPNVDIYFASDNCYALESRKKHSFLYRLTSRYKTYVALEEAVFSPKSKTKIITLTPQQKNDYQQMYGTLEEKFHVLPPDFDSRYQNLWDQNLTLALRKSYSIQPDEFLILMVCSAFKTKGVDRALCAIKDLPSDLQQKIHFFVIGNDKPDRYLKLAHQLKLIMPTQFLGGRNDVHIYMQAADLFIHPARQEAAGKVLLEALSSGLPVLTTQNCGYAEYIEAANAGIVLSEPFKHADLVNALTLMLSSTNNSWKTNGLNYLSNFPIKNLTQDAANFIADQIG